MAIVFLLAAGILVLWLIYVRRFWHCLHVLWVCRVSVLSAVGGGAVLTLTAQSRDLFADLGLTLLQWAVFFLLLFVWAWVVHGVGRRALQSDYWVPDAHCPGGLSEQRRQALRQEYWQVALWMPRLLGLLIFIFVGWALYDAEKNLIPARGLGEAEAALDQFAWLFAATTATALIYLLVAWSRRKVENRLAYGAEKRADEPPLLIGLVPFPLSIARWPQSGPVGDSRLVRGVRIGLFLVGILVTAGFVAAIAFPHAMAETFARAQMVPILFGSIVLVLGELVIWSYYWRTPLLLVLIIVSVVALFRADRFHDVQFIGGSKSNGIATGAAAQIGFDEAVKRWMAVNKCTGSDCPRPILIAGAGGASRAAFLTATVVGALFDRGPDIRNRVFAMSTVSGSSVGAVVMRAALADAAESENPNRPPCKPDTDQMAWFGDLKDGTRFRTKPDVTTSWLDCFQKLLAGDFLSPVIVGLAYRDNFPIQNPVNHQPLWPDRAVLLEESFERRYSSITTKQAKRCADAGNEGDGKGLCRRFGFHPHPRDVKDAWLPLLFINGTSVATGRRIIAADVPIGKSYKDKQLLLPFAYDVNEIRNWRPKRNEGDKPHEDRVEFCQMPAVTKGSDTAPSASAPGKTIDNCFRLSTASTLSARFPVISPQGNLRDRSADVRDKVVDGGYFENDAMATLADVAWALKATYGLHPVAIRIVNDPVPREGKEDSLGSGRPPLANEDERAFFDDVLSIVRTLTATRSGHEDGHKAYLEGALTVGPDKEEPAPADGKKKFTGAHGEDRLYEVHVYELKAVNEPAPQGTPVAKQRQVAQKPVQQFRLCRRNIDQAKIGKTAYMETVSMSWWMSHPVQAYLDAQLCVEANWNRLECELQEGRIAPGGTCR